jgi:uncharacterized protein YcbX
MIEVTALFVYPVKSCRGIELQQVEIGPRGFLHDREFLVVDENDAFLTQRNTPALATIDLAIGPEGFLFGAPRQLELRLGFDEIAARAVSGERRNVAIFRDRALADDMGHAAAEWFSSALQRTCRLVRVGDAFRREVPLARVAEAFRMPGAAPISFTDAFPTLITSEASLADLNTRLAMPIPMARFRPNIVVRGAAAYEEDTWTRVRVSQISFGCSAACLRCVITTTDQQTGARDGVEPLRTLATYRRAADGSGVMFGQYLVHAEPGMLRVGDALVVEA